VAVVTACFVEALVIGLLWQRLKQQRRLNKLATTLRDALDVAALERRGPETSSRGQGVAVDQGRQS
jgi:hypothetical protein